MNTFATGYAPATEVKAEDCILKKSKTVENTEHDL